MNGLLQFWRFAKIYQIMWWADTQGVRFSRSRTEAGRTFHPVWWYDPQGAVHSIEVEDLTELPRYINDLIGSGKARQPGKFYVHWNVEQWPTSGWWGTPFWVAVGVLEGAPPPHRWPGSSFDPTPYASPQEAVDTVAFLGLELGARLKFYADVRYLTGELKMIPTPSYSKEAVEELILNLAWRSRPVGVDEDDRGDLARMLESPTGVPEGGGRKAIRQLIAERRLVRERHYESVGWRRWLKPWKYRRSVRYAESGWVCELLLCSNCGVGGICPDCGGASLNPGKEEIGDMSSCAGCCRSIDQWEEGGMGLPFFSGRCGHCIGRGKVYQWRQTEPAAT